MLRTRKRRTGGDASAVARGDEDARIDLLVHALSGVPPHPITPEREGELSVTEQQLIRVAALSYYAAKLEPITHRRMVEIMRYSGLDDADIMALFDFAEREVIHDEPNEI